MKAGSLFFMQSRYIPAGAMCRYGVECVRVYVSEKRRYWCVVRKAEKERYTEFFVVGRECYVKSKRWEHGRVGQCRKAG